MFNNCTECKKPGVWISDKCYEKALFLGDADSKGQGLFSSVALPVEQLSNNGLQELSYEEIKPCINIKEETTLSFVLKGVPDFLDKKHFEPIENNTPFKFPTRTPEQIFNDIRQFGKVKQNG